MGEELGQKKKKHVVESGCAQKGLKITEGMHS